jgi:hypothetical protein
MKWTTSCARAPSNASSGHGSFEQRRRVDAGDVLSSEAVRELLGQDAGAAADVENALPGRDPAEVGEHRRQLARVAAHEAVVGITRDVEAHAGQRNRWSSRIRHAPVADTCARSRYARLGEEAGRT